MSRERPRLAPLPRQGPCRVELSVAIAAGKNHDQRLGVVVVMGVQGFLGSRATHLARHWTHQSTRCQGELYSVVRRRLLGIFRAEPIHVRALVARASALEVVISRADLWMFLMLPPRLRGTGARDRTEASPTALGLTDTREEQSAASGVFADALHAMRRRGS